MKQVTMRVGGVLVPAFVVLTGCSASVGGEDPSVRTSRYRVSGRLGVTVEEPIEVLPIGHRSILGNAGAGATCDATTVEGRAIGLQVDAGLDVSALGISAGVGAQVVLSDTGALPPTGGVYKADLLTAAVPGLLSAGVLEASTASSGDETVSNASVSGIALHLAGVGIAANVLASHAIAICETAGAAVAGSGNIAGLAIDGKGVVVTGRPNQTIVVGPVKIVLNEVLEASTSATSGSIHVAALHVTAPDIADVIVSEANAGVTCACPTPPPAPPIVSPPSCTTSTDCAAGNICFQGLCTAQGST